MDVQGLLELVVACSLPSVKNVDDTTHMIFVGPGFAPVYRYGFIVYWKVDG